MKLLLSKRYDAKKTDPTDYWISEKYDGVRCVYIASEQKLYSRTGHAINAPAYFTEMLSREINKVDPTAVIDGELWAGRGRFQTLVGIVRKKVPVPNEWINVTYQVFDIPSCRQAYEKRLEYLSAILGQREPRLQLISIYKCAGHDHLMDELRKIEALGGEGLMIREPNSLYEEKRSNTLLKVKSTIQEEATIIGYKEGKGKYIGMIGSLIVRNKGGKEYKVGTGLNDDDRQYPPSIGSLITVQYAELTRDDIPRFPVYICIRNYE